MPTAIIDLDHTLLDTTRFKGALAKSLDLTDTEWDAAYSAYMKDYGLFDPKQFLSGSSADQRKAFNEVLANTRKYLYKDSPQFLQQCQADGWEIIILTFGELQWQQQKIDNLHLPDHIRTVCTDQPKVDIIGEYINPDEETAFVNDRANEMDAIVQRYPDVTMYWVNRDNTPHTTPPQENAILKTDLSFQLLHKQ